MTKKNRLYCSTKGKSLKIREELLDQDYLHKLNPEERNWLLKFTEEYVGANFTHSGKRIHPKKFRTKIVKKTGKKRKVDIYKKACEDANNSRNRDAYGKAKILDKIVSDYPTNIGHNPEDEIIDIIDFHNEIENHIRNIKKP